MPARHALRSCLLLAVAALSACDTVNYAGGPAPAFNLDQDIEDLQQHYASATSIKAYYAAGPEIKERRNEFIVGRLSLYNLEYIKFVRQFYLSSAQLNSIIDISNIGLGLAATLVGDAVTKSILAAVATGLTGSRLAIERNFFQERTIQALVTQMNAQRTAALVPIARGLTQSIDEYPLASAIIDLNAYYEAGTIEGAITGIQVSAGQIQTAAERDLAQLRNIKSAPDQSSMVIRKWLYPSFVSEDASGRPLDASGQPAQPSPSRVAELQAWLKQNGLDIPIAVLLRAEDLAATRQMIIADLHIDSTQTVEAPQTAPPAGSARTGSHMRRPPAPTSHTRIASPALPGIAERDQSGVILGKWLYPSAVSQDTAGTFVDAAGRAAPADTQRLDQLRAWMKQNRLDVPIASLLHSATNQNDRRKAISELKIQ